MTNTEMIVVLYNLGRGNLGRGRFKLCLVFRHQWTFFENRKDVVQRGQIFLYRAVDGMSPHDCK